MKWYLSTFSYSRGMIKPVAIIYTIYILLVWQLGIGSAILRYIMPGRLIYFTGCISRLYLYVQNNNLARIAGMQ